MVVCFTTTQHFHTTTAMERPTSEPQLSVTECRRHKNKQLSVARDETYIERLRRKNERILSLKRQLQVCDSRDISYYEACLAHQRSCNINGGFVSGSGLSADRHDHRIKERVDRLKNPSKDGYELDGFVVDG